MNLIIIWSILIIYMLVMIGIGIYSNKYMIKDSTDYLLAGRRLGVFMMAGTLAATEIGGGSTVGVAAKAFGSWGLSAGWYVTSAGLGVILVSIIAPKLRRAMATTVPEIIGRRFGTPSYVLTSLLSVCSLIALAAVQVTATATIIHVLTGLSQTTAIIISGIVVVFYTYIGGMWSVTLTDIVQFIVILVGFTVAVPFAIHNAGGWNHIVKQLPPGQLGFTKVGWKTIIGLVLMYFMTFSTGQEAVQRYYSAKDEKTAVWGSIWCGGLMALYSFIPAVLGLIALAIFPKINANDAVAIVSTNLTPPLIAGIVMAAVMSATLSSASGDLLGASTVFIKDIWGRFVNTNLTDKQITSYTRLSVLVFGVLGIAISLKNGQIIPMLVFAFTMRSAGPFAAFIFGLVWNKATKHAGLWSIILGSISGFYWQYRGEPYGIMAVVVGSVVSVVTFVVVVAIERAMGHAYAPPAITETAITESTD